MTALSRSLAVSGLTANKVMMIWLMPQVADHDYVRTTRGAWRYGSQGRSVRICCKKPKRDGLRYAAPARMRVVRGLGHAYDCNIGHCAACVSGAPLRA